MTAIEVALLLDTLLLACLSAALATIVGGSFALLLTSYRVPAPRLLQLLLSLPFLLPAVVLTTELQALLGATALQPLLRGMTGVVFIEGMRWAPLVMWGALAAISALPSEEERALRLLPPGSAALRTRAARVRGVLLRMGALVAIFSMTMTEVAGYASVETIGTRIVARMTLGEDLQAWWLACGLVVVSLPLLLVVVSKLLQPGALAVPTVDGRAGLATDSRVNFLLWVFGSFPALLLIAIAVTAVPEASTSREALVEMGRSLGGVAIEFPRVLLVGALVTLIGWRLADGGHLWFAALLLIPALLPASVVGIVLVERVQPLLPASLDRWPILMTLAGILRFAAVGVVVGFIARVSLPAAEENAARLLKPAAGRWCVRGPRAFTLLAAGVLIVALLALGEVESGLLLIPAGHPSPALELHQLLHFRQDEQAGRLSLALAIGGGGLALVLVPLASRRKR